METFHRRRIAPALPVFFLFSVFLFLWHGSARAGSPGFLDSVNAEAYPAAHCVLSRELETIKVKKDGTYNDRDEVFLTILDEKGKAAQQVQQFYMNRNYSRFNVISMEVIRPDGQRAPVDLERNSNITDPSSAARMNIYDPNQKVMNVFIPGLEPGDTIHYIVEVVNFKPMIKGHFFGRSLVQQTFPVRQVDLKIELPAGMALHHLVKDRCRDASVTFGKKSLHGSTLYSWRFENVPELVPEPYMPETSRVAMRLLFSTLPDWQAVSEWYYRLVEPRLKVNDDIRSEVRRLVKGKKTERERLEALFFFVARKIRYLGIIEEANRPGFEPHDVTLTFERRYGVCRDKAALLVAMLRVAGFNAAPVIMSAGKKLDREIAVPYFNHAITAVLDDMGRPRIYMDPTSETSRQFLPDYEQESSCLPAVPQGSDLLLTPAKSPGSNLFVMEITDALGRDGALRGNVLCRTAGFADTAFRSLLMTKSRDQQERFLKIFLLRRQPALDIQDLSWTDPSDNSRSFSFECSFVLPGAMKQSGSIFSFSSARALGLMDGFLFRRASMIDRRYPLKMGYTFETLVRENMKIDRPYCRVDLPGAMDMDDAFMSYRTNYSLLPQGLEIEHRLSIKRLEIPPEEYRRLLEIQAAVDALHLNPLVSGPCGKE